MSFGTHKYSFVWALYSRDGIAGIVYMYVLQCQTVFWSDCTSLYSHQHCMRLPVVLCSHWHLILSEFFILAKLVDIQWYLTVAVICVSMITSNVEHLFICFLVILVPYLVKCLTLLLIFNWVVWVFFLLTCSFLFILDMTPISNVCIVDISSQSVAYLFTILMVL